MTRADGTPAPPDLVWELRAGGAVSVSAPSPQQEHLAAISGPGLRNVRLVAVIDGVVDTDRLRAATERVFTRHAALRQRLQRAANGGVRVLTFSSVHAPRQAADDAATVACLKRIADGGHELTLSPAAGSVDVVGFTRAIEAVAAEYDADSGPVGDVRPTPEEVADYFRGLLSDDDAASGRAYWDFSSAAGYAAPELARALGSGTAPPGGTASKTVPVPVTLAAAGRLVDLASRTATPVEAWVLTAWRVLLQRIGTAEGSAVGVYSAAAAHELRDTIGLLGRYVPMAVCDPASGTIAEAAVSCGSALRDAATWADFYRGPGDADGHVGYQAGFRYARTPDLLKAGEATITVTAVDAPIERCTIELETMSDGRHLTAAVRYGAGTDQLAARVAEWLGALLNTFPEQVAARPWDAAESALAPYTTAPVYGEVRDVGSVDVIALIAAQAEETPDSVAVRDDETHLTYAELVGQAAIFAEEITARGVGVGMPVVVCMQRRVPLMVAVLAVMWNGSYVVPLDPTFPRLRLQHLIAGSGAPLIVVDSATSATAPVSGSRVLKVEAAPRRAGRVATTARPPAAGGGAAYMIYTSGSTGTPKGVLVSHASLVNYLRWACSAYDVRGGCGTLLHSSISVDMTVTSMFVPLITGQAVTLLPSDEPQALADAVTAAVGLSLLKVTPSGLTLLTELVAGALIARATRHLVIGGEQLTSHTAGRLRGCDGLLVTNEYGPTETTVGSTAFTFRVGEPVPDPVPVGVPIWNTRVEVVTRDGRRCLEGVVGEVVISGAGVASGYDGRPDETAACFAAEVDGSGGPPIRSYRTGDLGRVRDDGGLELVAGRFDAQTKVHGFRVDLSEVEQALLQHPRVTLAAVVAVTAGEAGGVFLSAFVAAEGPTGALAGELRMMIGEQLPFYARPDRIEVVGRLPVARSGKLDRGVLVDMSQRPSHTIDGPSGVSGEAAAALADAWRKVLGRPAFTLDDNFFASGADSIRALQFVAEVRAAGLAITVQDVLHHRTLRALAAVATPVAEPRRDAGRRFVGEVPLSANQAGVLRRGSVYPAGWALRWEFEAAPDIDVPRLVSVLRAVHERHPSLRVRFVVRDGDWTVYVAAPSDPEPHVVDLSDVPDGERDTRVGELLDGCAASLDADGPAVHLWVFLRGGGLDSKLVWVAHHLVCDVVSLQILTRELQDAYAGERVRADDRYVDWAGTASQPPTCFAGHTRAGGLRVVRAAVGGETLTHLRRAAAGRPARWLTSPLAAALLRALASVRPDVPTEVCAEGYGRADPAVDLSSTVGWLTEFSIGSADREDLGDVRRLVHRLDSHFSLNGPQRGALPPVALNYFGALGDTSDANAIAKVGGSPAGQRGSAPLFGLEVVCWSDAGRMEVLWQYSPEWITPAAVQRLADIFAAELRFVAGDLAAEPAAPTSPAAVVSSAGLGPADLDRILETFGES